MFKHQASALCGMCCANDPTIFGHMFIYMVWYGIVYGMHNSLYSIYGRFDFNFKDKQLRMNEEKGNFFKKIHFSKCCQQTGVFIDKNTFSIMTDEIIYLAWVGVIQYNSLYEAVKCFNFILCNYCRWYVVEKCVGYFIRNIV